MFYENKYEKRKDKIIMFVLLSVIILLLCIVILELDKYTEKIPTEVNYKVEKLSTFNEQNVHNTEPKIPEEVIKSVVGISKFQNKNNTIFLDNRQEYAGLGSGIILTENGYILTNYHVAGNKYSNCYVTLKDGKTYTGTVVWEDSNIDLAIIKIGAINLDYIVLGDSDSICLAQEVYAVGNPIGVEFQRTITKGIISGINRTVKIDEENYMEDLIQTDATINEGNSGGPLINSNGELIGVNTIKIKNAEGIGFAVPINLIKPILERLMENGKFEEAYLGIFGYDKEVIPYLDSSLDLDSGIYIVAIPIDSPLKQEDISVGDIIVEIDNVKLNKMNDLKKFVYSKKPKDNVTLKIRHQKEEKEVKVQLGYK